MARMAIQIHRAVANFDHPLEMLTACHERIEAQCETLRRLAEHMPRHGCDAQAQQAASNVMRYFDSAVRHHREDDEPNLLNPHALRPIKLASSVQSVTRLWK
jgi:hypothetical protein